MDFCIVIMKVLNNYIKYLIIEERNTYMYSLENFCNIIATLRKERGWTQNMLAEKLGISSQSVSKWECGIGYPDVTLFPIIAEEMQVPIGVLFGENSVQKNVKQNYFSLLEECDVIKVHLGNICRVEFIENENIPCSVQAQGDEIFLHYFDVEYTDTMLCVTIKNPSGSEESWETYDRNGYNGENYVQISTGRRKDKTDICVINYLDLKVKSRENYRGNYEVVCSN